MAEEGCVHMTNLYARYLPFGRQWVALPKYKMADPNSKNEYLNLTVLWGLLSHRPQKGNAISFM